MRRLGVAAVVALVVAAGFFAVGRGAVPCDVLAAQPACQVAVQPGPSEDALPLVTVDGTTVHPPAGGELRMTTIAVHEDLGWWEWARWRGSAVTEVVPREAVFPVDEDREDTTERNAAAMAESQLVATVAALRHLGHQLPGEGARVVGHAEDTAAEAVEVGEVVTAVDDVEVAESRDAVEAVSARTPGEVLTLTLRGEDGASRELEVTAGAAPDDPERAYLGVLLVTELELPVDVAIDTGVVGGPSAGLVFALAIVELLQAEDLLDGRVVAGTGTVTADGEVGAVGGVPQKLAGVTTGIGGPPAEVFVLPRANLAEARRAVVGEDVLLVPVDDLGQAVEALRALRDGRTPERSEVLAAG